MKHLVKFSIFAFLVSLGASAFAHHGYKTRSYNPYTGVTTIVKKLHNGSKIVIKRNRWGRVISRRHIPAPRYYGPRWSSRHYYGPRYYAPRPVVVRPHVHVPTRAVKRHIKKHRVRKSIVKSHHRAHRKLHRALFH